MFIYCKTHNHKIGYVIAGYLDKDWVLDMAVGESMYYEFGFQS